MLYQSNLASKVQHCMAAKLLQWNSGLAASLVPGKGGHLIIWMKCAPNQAVFTAAFCSLRTTLDKGLPEFGPEFNSSGGRRRSLNRDATFPRPPPFPGLYRPGLPPAAKAKLPRPRNLGCAQLEIRIRSQCPTLHLRYLSQPNSLLHSSDSRMVQKHLVRTTTHKSCLHQKFVIFPLFPLSPLLDHGSAALSVNRADLY